MSSSLKFLGTDSGFGSNNNSAYLEIDKNFILIDCGFAVFEKLKNFDLKKYDSINVIITHLHNDHVGSLSQMILYLWFIYGKKTKVISKCKNIKEYLEITGTIEEAYTVTDNLDCIELQFIETEHVKDLDCYGFKATINRKKIIYTGDTNTLKPFKEYMFGVNELYVDTSKFGGVHIKFDDVFEELKDFKKAGIDVYLMHIDDYEYIKSRNNNEFFFAK